PECLLGLQPPSSLRWPQFELMVSSQNRFTWAKAPNRGYHYDSTGEKPEGVTTFSPTVRFAVEPLTIILRQTESIVGIPFGGRSHKLSLFEDNLLTLIQSATSLSAGVSVL
ncbi:hypothetical protein NDU88_008873, partial [Pleurodeles waltl]